LGRRSGRAETAPPSAPFVAILAQLVVVRPDLGEFGQHDERNT
jgi:hypothetical protein